MAAHESIFMLRDLVGKSDSRDRVHPTKAADGRKRLGAIRSCYWRGPARRAAVLSEGKRAPEEQQPDERGMAEVYMICVPVTHYYRIMTRNDQVPVLIEERI
jgi:hypothetical protein